MSSIKAGFINLFSMFNLSPIVIIKKQVRRSPGRSFMRLEIVQLKEMNI